MDENPEVVQSFRDASIRGWDYAMDNSSEVISWIKQSYAPNADEDLLEYEALAMRELILPDLVDMGQMSRSRWEEIAKTYASQGKTDPEIDLSEFLYDPNPARDYTWLRRLGTGVMVLLVLLFIWTAFLLLHNRRLRKELMRQMEQMTETNKDLREEVAKRKRIVEELLKSEERYRELFEESESLMLLVRQQGQILDANEKALSGLGFRKEDVRGKNILDFALPEDHEQITQLVRASYEKIPVPPVEFQVKTPRGLRSLLFSEGPGTIIQRDGEDVLLVSALDITDLNQTQQALRESEERFALAVAGSADAIWDWNIISDESWFSDRLKEQLGFEPDELDCQSVDIKDFIHPDDDNQVWENLQAHLETGATFDCEFRLRTKSGEYRWFRGRGQALWNESGEPFRMAGSIQDITARKDAEEIRARLESQLRQAQKMEAVGQLAGGVAHDFNNLLQAIQGYSTLAQRSIEEGNPALDDLAEVDRASTRAAVLVRQLLAFSRQEEMKPRPVDLNDIVTGLLKMLRRLIGEHIDLTFVHGNELGMVMADPGQIEQILINLCVNARDAMPRGGAITIRTEKILLNREFCDEHAWSREGSFAVLCVKDEGPGIPEKIRDRIFEPFFTTKDVGEGTGLGLATVYGIVKQHEGLIEIRSQEDEGAEFRIYLPNNVRIEQNDEETGNVERSVERCSGTILLAEDDELIRGLTVRILEKAGYHVLVARNGEEAVECYLRSAERVNAVLLDVVMPRKSGPEVAEEIRKMRPDLPVLFMSGYSGNHLPSHFTPDPITELVQKPLKPTDLLKSLCSLLSRSNTPVN